MVAEGGGGFTGAPALVAGVAGALWLEPGGPAGLPAEETLAELDRATARQRFEDGARPLLCHGAAVARRLGARRAPAFDLLELFAFVRPARFCVPTPRGLAQALGIACGGGLDAQVRALHAAARLLLEEIAALAPAAVARAAPIAAAMAEGGWPWAGDVARALATARRRTAAAGAADEAWRPSLDVWSALGEWSEAPLAAPPGQHEVSEAEIRQRLAALVRGRASAPDEARPQQGDYAAALAPAFAPRRREGQPQAVLAEAGTGVGKTLGYIAPASLWAEKNRGSVQISTYTRNLQHQVERELEKLVPDEGARRRRVALRKGRENYLCLLNFAEAAGRAAARPGDAVPLGLMARWIQATGEGDMSGGDFCGWLVELAGKPHSLGLADRRGECVHSVCPHYRRCFVEASLARARRADLVVANHALTLAQAAGAGEGEARLPSRYVFDEGHRLFDVADDVFRQCMSGREGEDLRRWLLGGEGSSRRARGLALRLGDLLTEDDRRALEDMRRAARALPAPGWRQRLAEGVPQGPAEAFLALLRRQVLARAGTADAAYGIECPPLPALDGLHEAGAALAAALEALARPLLELKRRLAALAEERAGELDASTHLRIEAMLRGLDRRALETLRAWRAMLARLRGGEEEGFVDRFALERDEGREIDVGMYRHALDPGKPFADTMAACAHGLVVTSATLRDGGGLPLSGGGGSAAEAGWEAARLRSGLRHLAAAPREAAQASPFDHGALTRLLIVTDVGRQRPARVAAAFRALFLASGGGALGLFTAIRRLRDVHRRIAAALEHAGLALYAQHVDAMATATLVDIFRAEEDACLLGTDAVRDGVDVPGRSLRLIVFERVPWPRPDLLHKARREAFGGGWDDLIVRLRLAQAFGRLVRRAGDRGVFAILDPGLPSRLLSAFPEGVEAQRVSLAEAVAAVRGHLGS